MTRDLGQALIEWRESRRDRFTFEDRYRMCVVPKCSTQISVSASRTHCFFHGGKPGYRTPTSPQVVHRNV